MRQNTNKKKNILLIIPHLSQGGAQRAIANLSIALEKYYNIYFCILENRAGIDYYVSKKIINLNIPYTSNIFVKLFRFFSRIKRLKQLKHDHSIDCSISFVEVANFINILSKCNDKICISVRTFLSKSEKGLYKYIVRLLVSLLYNRADFIVSVTKGIAHDLIDHYHLQEAHLRTIYNYYNIDEIYRASREKLEDCYRPIFNGQVIINVGRLANQKGQGSLIRVFSEVKKYCSAAKLLILGNGPLRETLISLAESYGLKVFSAQDYSKITAEYDVYFLGFIKNPFKFIAKSELFVLSSIFEGIANVVIEAMACGTLPVSSDCQSGPREIIAPSTGVTYRTKTVEYAEYGILMPVFKQKKWHVRRKLKLDEIESLWAVTLAALLNNSIIRQEYVRKILDRAAHFSMEKTLCEWRSLIDS